MRLLLSLCFSFCISLSFCANEKDSIEVVKEYSQIWHTKDISIPQKIEMKEKLLSKARSVGMSPIWINNFSYYLAQEYSRIGDFDRALEINEVSLKYYLSIQNYEDIVWSYNDKAIYLIGKKQYRKALEYLRRGLAIAEKHNITSSLAELYNAMASAHLLLSQFEKANEYIQKEKERFAFSDTSEIDIKRVYYFYNLAEYQRGLGNLELSKLTYQKSIAFAKKIGNRKGMEVMQRLSEVYELTGQLDRAKYILEDMLHIYGVVNDPTIQEAYLLSAYSSLAKICYKIGDLKSARNWVKRSETLAEYFHAQYLFNNSKFILDDLRRSNLEMGVVIAYDLYKKSQNSTHISEALVLADKSKSNVLNERLIHNNRLQSDSINTEQRLLRYSLSADLYSYESGGKNEAAILTRSILDSLDLVLGLKKSKPFNYEAVSKIQSQLNQDQLVIEYFITDSSLFIFSLTQSDISINLIPFDFSSDATRFYNLLKNPQSSIDEFYMIGSLLFTKLLAPVLDKTSNIDQITIIPDKSINYIIFEALPTKSGPLEWSSVPYTMNSFNITYEFSLESLTLQNTFDLTNTYIGFASDYSNNSEVTFLKNSVQNVQFAQHLFGGKTYENNMAAADSFIACDVGSNILHLYTHGVASDSAFNASYLFFNDRKMYVNEVMTLPINTNLCVLTACEVGLGKHYSGEGVTGVAWAFRGAGANNVMQSLWKLNDQSSHTLMISFFELLESGNSSTIALADAKKIYLKSPEISNRMKHPFYWAGINHVGLGMKVNPSKTNKKLWFLFGGILLVLLSVYYSWFRKRKT